MTGRRCTGAPHAHAGPLSITFDLADAAGRAVPAGLRVVAPGQFRLTVASPFALAGIADDPAWHERARTFARRGQVVHVVHEGHHLVSLGSVTATAEEVAVTGCERIALGAAAGAADALASWDARLSP